MNKNNQNAVFKIFVKSKKFRLTQGVKIVLPLAGLIGLSYLGDLFFLNSFLNNIIRGLLFVNLFIMFFFMVYRFFQYEKLNGILQAELRFFSDKIEIENRIILVSQIKKLEVRDGDFHGKSTNWTHGLDPIISQGVKNNVYLKLKNGEEIAVYFKQEYKDEFFIKCKPFFIGYYHAEVISFLRLTEFLRIDKYEDIQAFKAELKSLEK